MASQLQELANLLPGGTYISFSVLAQLTTNTTEMANRLTQPGCQCPNGTLADAACTSAYICGAGYYQMSIALVVVSALVVYTLAWYGADLQTQKTTVVSASEDKQKRASMARCPGTAAAAAAAVAAAGGTESGVAQPPHDLPSAFEGGTASGPAAAAAPQATGAAPTVPTVAPTVGKKPGSILGKLTAAAAGAAASNANSGGSSSSMVPIPQVFIEAVQKMTAAELRRKYAELVIHQFIWAFGSVLIFLVLALFTPPISTCLLQPCHVPSVVCTVIPLLVSFAVSAFVAVQKQFVHRMVFFWDYLLFPADREPAKWSILTSGAKLVREQHSAALAAAV